MAKIRRNIEETNTGHLVTLPNGRGVVDNVACHVTLSDQFLFGVCLKAKLDY